MYCTIFKHELMYEYTMYRTLICAVETFHILVKQSKVQNLTSLPK